MIRLRPVRNICIVDNNIWFISKEINALFKYNVIDKNIDFVSLPPQIDRDYMYLGTYYFDNKIYLPPVFAKGFGEYDIEADEFRTIETPNSSNDCNFGDSFSVQENKIFCTPNSMDGSFVLFDMEKQQEVTEPFYFPKKLVTESNFPTVVKKSTDNIYYGLIYPANIVFKLNLDKREFNYYDFSKINEEIVSFFVDEEYFYLSTKGKLFVADFDTNVLVTKETISDKVTFFIGKINEYIFADIPSNPIKNMVRFENGKLNVRQFDESEYFSHYDGNVPGIIYSDGKKHLYFSSGSNGIFDFSANDAEFLDLKLDEDILEKINSIYAKSLTIDTVRNEGEIFGLHELVEGMGKIL